MSGTIEILLDDVEINQTSKFQKSSFKNNSSGSKLQRKDSKVKFGKVEIEYFEVSSPDDTPDCSTKEESFSDLVQEFDKKTQNTQQFSELKWIRTSCIPFFGTFFMILFAGLGFLLTLPMICFSQSSSRTYRILETAFCAIDCTALAISFSVIFSKPVNKYGPIAIMAYFVIYSLHSCSQIILGERTILLSFQFFQIRPLEVESSTLEWFIPCVSACGSCFILACYEILRTESKFFTIISQLFSTACLLYGLTLVCIHTMFAADSKAMKSDQPSSIQIAKMHHFFHNHGYVYLDGFVKQAELENLLQSHSSDSLGHEMNTQLMEAQTELLQIEEPSDSRHDRRRHQIKGVQRRSSEDISVGLQGSLSDMFNVDVHVKE